MHGLPTHSSFKHGGQHCSHSFQASVTLAICFLPLHLTEIFVGTASESFANYRGWADELATTAVLGSIIVTPLANLAIQILAPQLQKVRKTV
jgi:hypothetical protein